MSSIVIVTDSASDIEPSLQRELGIEVVPLKVMFGEETYTPGIDLDTRTFYAKLTESNVLPSTSQPSPHDFAETFRRIAAERGSDVQIIAILLSAALSGTYQSAVLGRSMLEEELDITLIDSKKASFVHGLVAVEAARAAKAGKTKDEILALVERLLSEVQVYFLVDSLTHLQKGGRIGRASALLGSLLNIKPILSLDPSGVVYPFDKVRGTKKALARIVDEMKTYAQDHPVKVAVMHGNVPEEGADLLARLHQVLNVQESFLAELGPVIGTHAGPGTIGCVVVKTG